MHFYLFFLLGFTYFASSSVEVRPSLRARLPYLPGVRHNPEFKKTFSNNLKNITNGTSYGESSQMTVFFYTAPNCVNTTIQFYALDLVYGEDFVTVDSSNVSLPSLNYLSFYIFRRLREGEQLDISYWGQDPGQVQPWGCGAFLESYLGGTNLGCYNVKNPSGAECVRLWHW